MSTGEADMPGGQPVELDQASIQEILDLGGEELLSDLVADFRGFADQAVVTIDESAATGDCATVKEAAHSIKSTSRALGALDLHRQLIDLESAAGTGDVDTVRTMVPELHSALAAANAALAARAGV